MKDNIETLMNFYVRIPYNSLKYYDNYLKQITKEDLNYLTKNNMFSEIIYSTSYDLFKSFQNFNSSLVESNKSLLKYMIRSSCRTTPYGLLSGVAKGKFSIDQNLSLESNWLKKASIDAEWLLEYYKIIESKIGCDLKVCFNNALDLETDRIYNLWTTYYVNNNNSFDISNSNLLKKLLNFCPYGNFKNIKEIYEIIQSEYVIEISTINYYIHQLLENEFLISDIRMPSLNTSSLDHLISKTKEYRLDEETNFLVNVKGYLEEYNSLIINDSKSLNLYQKIFNMLQEKYKCKNILKFDLYSEQLIEFPLNEKNKFVELKKFIDCFENDYRYNEYFDAYIEKYGMVPVRYLDMIKEISGLGHPSIDKFNDKININYHHLDAYLYKLNGSHIDLSNLYIKLDKSDKTMGSIEIACSPIKNKKGYEYIITQMIGSNMAEKSFGRFSYLFKNEIGLNPIQEEMVEVSFIPKKKRISNVLSCQSNCSSFIEFAYFTDNNKVRIDLNDIYVYPYEGKLFFLDKKNNKILKFVSTNMTNLSFYPNVLKTLLLLSEAQDNNYFSFFTYINKYYEKVFHCPEIRYKDFILFPEKWKLKKEMFECLNNYEEFISSFMKIRKTHCLNCSLVNVGYLDNYLLLNLNNDIHLELLYEMIKTNKEIFIAKSYINSNNSILTINSEPHISEFIFQIRNKNNYYENLKLPIANLKINKHNNIFLPFDKCVYLKLYTKKNDQNSLLITYINDFIQQITNKNLTNKLFYIRYKDKYHHLRLRIFFNDSQKEEILKNVILFQRKVYLSNIVKKIIIDSYEREYQRYGGEKNIDFFEEYFTCETIDIINILNQVRKKKLNLAIETVFVLTTIHTLKTLFVSEKEILKLLDNFKVKNSQKKELSIFKKENKNLLCNILNGEWNDLNLMPKTFDKDYELYKKNKRGDLNDYSYNEIVLSMIHMRFNRMIGIDRINEIKFMAFIENIIYSNMKRKQYEKK